MLTSIRFTSPDTVRPPSVGLAPKQYLRVDCLRGPAASALLTETGQRTILTADLRRAILDLGEGQSLRHRPAVLHVGAVEQHGSMACCDVARALVGKTGATTVSEYSNAAPV